MWRSERILSAMFESFTCACLSTTGQEASGCSRKPSSSLASFKENPSSCARLMKRTRAAVSGGKARYPLDVRGGRGNSPSRS